MLTGGASVGMRLINFNNGAKLALIEASNDENIVDNKFGEIKDYDKAPRFETSSLKFPKSSSIFAIH